MTELKLMMLAFFCVFVLFTACANQEPQEESLSQNAETAKELLEGKGYEILSYKGSYEKKVERAALAKMPERNFWAVQDVPPDRFIGETVEVFQFNVTNHPLDKAYVNDENYTHAHVSVYINNNKPFGGSSVPIGNKAYSSPGNSIDGRTAEVVQDDYEQWVETWLSNYGDE
ncbi:hypothetical protein [Aureibacillus halotolerans]|uniref:DUF4825 domain-containing protein n=1 Tax=Aureibacillus halotolerans TaxID=1508390 RepID=A0A4R6U9W8_9BACI|nr:hypothetical protein [Aureibacillus halotolerans]TDQ42626.1 hypothetical protein EV213_10154 [Aureibacillus halotolerans]